MLGLKEVQRRADSAWNNRTMWTEDWNRIYRYCFPGRPDFYTQVEGENRARQIFDSTGLNGVQEFANMMAENFDDFRLEPGAEVVLTDAERLQTQQALDTVGAHIRNAILASGFEEVTHELMLDLSVGWTVLWMDEPRIADGRLFQFTRMPQTQMAMLCGPDGKPYLFLRVMSLTREEFVARYPDAREPTALSGEDSGTKSEYRDCVYRDFDELGTPTWHRVVWNDKLDGKPPLFGETYRGSGACPVIAARWQATGYEAYGRGPAYMALAEIQSANLVTQLILENADMAVAGVWQADDDGVIPVDQIKLVPGTVIPRDPDSRGLEPLSPAGQFDLSLLTLERLQNSIREYLYNAPARPADRTPRSATEIIDNQVERAKKVGAPYNRVFSELMIPVIQRAAYIMRRRGIIQVPKIGGREIRVVSRSPLAKAARLENINQFQIFDATMKQTFGEVAIAEYDPMRVREYLRSQLEIPAPLFSSPEQVQQRRAMMAQAMMGPQENATSEQVPAA